MAQILIEAEISTEGLMAAIERLSADDVNDVSRRLLRIQAERRAPHLSNQESELLRTIYKEKRPGFRERFDELREMSRNRTITAQEQEEFVDLCNEAEAFDAERMQAVGLLAAIRNKSLLETMVELGLRAPSVV